MGQGSGHREGAFRPRVVGAVALGIVASVLAALILGEYEFRGVLPYAAAALLGLVIGELVAEVGRYRSRPLGGLCGAMTAGAILWAAWIDAGQGLRPLPVSVWPAMAIGAVTAGVRAGGWRRRPAAPDEPATH